MIAECDQEIEAGIRAFEATSEPPARWPMSERMREPMLSRSR